MSTNKFNSYSSSTPEFDAWFDEERRKAVEVEYDEEEDTDDVDFDEMDDKDEY